MNIIETLRTPRIGGYALFDFAVSFLAVYLLAPTLTKLARKIRLEIPTHSWLYLTVPLSIVIHGLIGTMTPLTLGFIDLHGHIFIKLVVILLVVLGVKDIRVISKKNK